MSVWMGAGAYTKMTENGIPMMRQSTQNALFPRTRVHMHRRGFEIVSRSSLSRVESARCRHGLQVEGNSTSGRQEGIRAGIIYPFHTDSLKKPLPEATNVGFAGAMPTSPKYL